MQDNGITTEDDRLRAELLKWEQDFVKTHGTWPTPHHLAAHIQGPDSYAMKVMTLYMAMPSTKERAKLETGHDRTGLSLWWYRRTYPEQHLIRFAAHLIAIGLVVIAFQFYMGNLP